MKFPRNPTIKELFEPAIEITDQSEADAYFEVLVSFTVLAHGKTRAEAETMTRNNIAYYAGYYDATVRERVERLFKCVHPVSARLLKTAIRRPNRLINLACKWRKIEANDKQCQPAKYRFAGWHCLLQ